MVFCKHRDRASYGILLYIEHRLHLDLDCGPYMGELQLFQETVVGVHCKFPLVLLPMERWSVSVRQSVVRVIWDGCIWDGDMGLELIGLSRRTYDLNEYRRMRIDGD